MPLPLVLGAIFGAWSLLDLISYATTGNDIVYHFSDMMGWVTVSGDPGDLTIEFIEGMGWLEFMSNYAIYLTALLAVGFLTFWFSTRPFKNKKGRKA